MCWLHHTHCTAAPLHTQLLGQQGVWATLHDSHAVRVCMKFVKMQAIVECVERHHGSFSFSKAGYAQLHLLAVKSGCSSSESHALSMCSALMLCLQTDNPRCCIRLILQVLVQAISVGLPRHNALQLGSRLASTAASLVSTKHGIYTLVALTNELVSLDATSDELVRDIIVTLALKLQVGLAGDGRTGGGACFAVLCGRTHCVPPDSALCLTLVT